MELAYVSFFAKLYAPVRVGGKIIPYIDTPCPAADGTPSTVREVNGLGNILESRPLAERGLAERLFSKIQSAAARGDKDIECEPPPPLLNKAPFGAALGCCMNLPRCRAAADKWRSHADDASDVKDLMDVQKAIKQQVCCVPGAPFTG